MTEYKIFVHTLVEGNYNVDNKKINNELEHFTKVNHDYTPYDKSQLYTQGNKILFVQPFVKYDTTLTDKFLEILLDELKLIPGFGSAYLQAENRYNELIKHNTKHHGGKKNKTLKKNKTTIK